MNPVITSHYPAAPKPSEGGSLIAILRSRSVFILVALALGSFALCEMAQAVVPAPDGGYPGGNTAEGQNALFSLTTGGFNTAVGFLSLRSNTSGQLNTATGAGTLLANNADQNTATGAGALFSNTTGFVNTASGAFALFSNTTGAGNTANGVEALFSNTGDNNTANGDDALLSNTTGSSNTANGVGALFSNTTGSSNTALGDDAGIGITTANSVICIGATGANVSNSCFIGNIRGKTTQNANAIPVLIDSAGQLGTASSSRRFKNEIKPMDSASESILALKPVTFHYKSDKTSTPQFGLIAEEVAEVNPDLVVRDEKGEIYTVRYDAVNAMLLNEFLKEHRTVEEHEATITQVKSTVAKQEAKIAQQQKDFQSKFAEQEKQLKALTSGMEKVSAQLEVTRPAPRTVVNNQ